MLTENDRQAFLDVMEELAAIYGKEFALMQARAYWRALREHDLQAIKAAVEAHVKNPDEGRFFPTPAHLIAKMPSNRARLSTEEAWAIARKSMDDTETVLINDEILNARTMARDTFLDGDEIGARLIFRRAYERIVAGREASGHKSTWHVSLGHDPGGRETVVRAAESRGLITSQQARELLPSSKDPGVFRGIWKPMLPAANGAQTPTEKARDRLQSILAQLEEGKRIDDEKRLARLREKRERFERNRRKALKYCGLEESDQTAAGREIAKKFNPREART